MKKKILYGVIVIVIVIQFFRIDKSNPAITPSHDFIEMNQPAEEITTLLKSACYDCHSNETVYPWYTNIAPVSWWIKHHIEEGREEMNFSEWGTFKEKKQDHKLEESYEMLEEGEMPLDSYTWTHADAKLNPEQKELLIEFFKSLHEK
jgi:hypothetical protein